MASSTPFPAASSSSNPATQFHIADPALPSEMIAVINVSGSTWTVIRGAEGTTPVAHAGGFTIWQVVTAGWMGSLSKAGVTGALVNAMNVLNVITYGADPSGVSDSTAAIQAALNAVGSASSGPTVVYFPAGDYLTSSALTYSSSSFPLVMTGDSTAGHLGRKTGGSTIHMTFAPGHGITVSGAPYFRLTDIDIAVDGTNSGGATADYSGIYASGINFVEITRSQIYKNNGNFSVNSPIRLVNVTGAIIRDCSIGGEQSGIWQDGGSGITIEDTFITTTIGNGFGAIRMDNTLGTGAATIQLSNVVTFRGDWGFYAGGSGNTPLFVYMNNIQINNPRKGGIYFQAGSQFWGDYVWISMAGVANTINTTGVLLDTGFQGWFYLYNSVIQSPSNHGMLINAGQGIVLDGVSFGGCGNATANTYDDLHIGSAASNITVTGCHFDVDKFNTINGPARSAIFAESGATGILAHGNQMASSGYGTATIVNNATAATVRFKDNLGYNPVGFISSPPAVAGSTTAVTNNTGLDASVIVTLAAPGGATSISIGGHATGLSATVGSSVMPPVRVPAGQTIALTYSNTPTWAWWGD